MLGEAPSEGDGLIMLLTLILTLKFARLCIIALRSFVATNMLQLNVFLQSQRGAVFA